ncbi:DUF6626 family protein [Magnetovibrio blakemorei]|uniref:Uncharacterized protein n=1 Tax=Magnetovibrio blakemorei TaxID=28181 RepID=A0A1E5Q4L1_9PROT|nr:DUF6626 family protein [Magnetovibrio blakemorei]OEJ65192.1 hypothetical protein BEN30_15075 [Magnetovibrio blakemorei]
MNEVLQQVYDELALQQMNLSQRQFSRDWLGKCETYFAYLKSTGKEPSADALLKLFGNLSKRKQVYQKRMDTTDNDGLKYLIQENINMCERLRAQVYTNMTYSY